MSRPARMIRNVVAGIGILVVLLSMVAIFVIRTDWFRETVRQKIIATTEDATGGKVDLGSFDFDIFHMRAIIRNFVIHGREDTGSAPFLRIEQVEIHLRPFTSIRHIIDITYLGVQRPEVRVIVFADGSTSIPTPKQTGSNTAESPLATVVDLAVGQFELSNGLIQFDQRKHDLNLRGSNLRAKLNWNLVRQSYQGELSLEPLYVVAGRNTPVNFKINLPLELERDRINVRHASISTPQSNLQLDASMENMKNSRMSAHVQGTIALADLKNAGNLPLSLSATNTPSNLNVDANLTLADNQIEVTGLRAALGQSTVEASGTLQDPKNHGVLSFRSDLALGELSRLVNLDVRAQGQLLLNGTAKLDAAYNYEADGNVEAKNLSIDEQKQHIRNVNFDSAIHVDPHHLDLRGLRLSALGGQFGGNASLDDWARYKVDGNLRNIDLEQVVRQLAPQQRLPYSGIAGGSVNVTGDAASPGIKSLLATAKLTIAPGQRGIPLSGKLDVDYRGSNDQIAVRNSYLSLPHSKLTLSGSVGKQLDLVLTTTDLDDLLAAAAMSGAKALVRLARGGEAKFTGAVTGSLSSPRIAGHIGVEHFSVESRQFNALQVDLAASKTQATVSNGSVTRAAMAATFAGQVGLRDWVPTSSQKLTADASLKNGDMADLIALAGEEPAGYSGTVAADVHIIGTVGNPQGSASIQAANGTVYGQPFDQLRARANLADQLVTVPAAFMTSGGSRVDVKGEFEHPRDSFTVGQIHLSVQSSQFDLSRVHQLQQQMPNTAGNVQMNVDLRAQLGPDFLLVNAVDGNAAIRGLRMQNISYGDLMADARTSNRSVTYHATSNFSGSAVHVTGTTQLSANYATTAEADIRNLPIAPLLALAKEASVPATGKLTGTAHVSGTLAKPQGSVDFDLASGAVYDEPFDHVRVKATYLDSSIDVPQFEAVSGASRVTMSAHYDHPPADLQSGTLKFQVNSNSVDLARIKNLQKFRPGIAGHLQINGEGGATVRSVEPRLLLTSVNAKVAATGVSAQGKNLGDVTLAASTTSADHLSFTLNSNLAGATIEGKGNAQLSGRYPLSAQVGFKNVTWSRLQPIVGTTNGDPSPFEGAVDGQMTVEGPALDRNQLRGAVNLSRLYLTTLPQPGSGSKPFDLQNDGPIVVNLDKGIVRVQSAHLKGQKTTIQAGGTASVLGGGLNLTLKANADLALLEGLSRDIDSSSGAIILATTVRGTTTNPQVNGTLELQNAGLHYAGVANGLSKANGTIVFNGTSANIRNLSAETGGGTITATGFVGFADKLRFGLRANGSRIRILAQQDVTLMTTADVRLTGTSDSSQVTGTVTIQGVNYRPQSDIGSLLSRAAPPVQVASAPSPLLDNMRLDIRVRTSNAMTVQASVAQNLQAEADLHIRGTATQPGILGRVNISEGQLVFFGSTFTVNSGTIGFYNPVRIEPILDISLETQAKGVDVVLHVTGPVDNMKLSYTSDPPLQFQEIVGLLAAGKTPTSDPTLLANQPSAPQQSFQQMGESALVSKALADPVSSQLQRVFGVSQLKIDPAFTNGSQVPQARLTLQQQITSNVTFTYISALDDPNSTVVRVEWAFNPRWSAVATRDENGIFSVNLFYKKHFR